MSTLTVNTLCRDHSAVTKSKCRGLTTTDHACPADPHNAIAQVLLLEIHCLHFHYTAVTRPQFWRQADNIMMLSGDCQSSTRCRAHGDSSAAGSYCQQIAHGCRRSQAWAAAGRSLRGPHSACRRAPARHALDCAQRRRHAAAHTSLRCVACQQPAEAPDAAVAAGIPLSSEVLTAPGQRLLDVLIQGAVSNFVSAVKSELAAVRSHATLHKGSNMQAQLQ